MRNTLAESYYYVPTQLGIKVVIERFWILEKTIIPITMSLLVWNQFRFIFWE